MITVIKNISDEEMLEAKLLINKHNSKVQTSPNYDPNTHKNIFYTLDVSGYHEVFIPFGAAERVED